jgi:hypothetical protein
MIVLCERHGGANDMFHFSQFLTHIIPLSLKLT